MAFAHSRAGPVLSEKSLWSSSDGAKWVATCLPPRGAVLCHLGLGPRSCNPEMLTMGSEGCSPARLPAQGLPCHLPSCPVLGPASDSFKSPALAAKGPAACDAHSRFAGPRTTQAVETTRKLLVGAPGASGLVICVPPFPLPLTEEVTEGAAARRDPLQPRLRALAPAWVPRPAAGFRPLPCHRRALGGPGPCHRALWGPPGLPRLPWLCRPSLSTDWGSGNPGVMAHVLCSRGAAKRGGRQNRCGPCTGGSPLSWDAGPDPAMLAMLAGLGVPRGLGTVSWG